MLICVDTAFKDNIASVRGVLWFRGEVKLCWEKILSASNSILSFEIYVIIEILIKFHTFHLQLHVVVQTDSSQTIKEITRKNFDQP